MWDRLGSDNPRFRGENIIQLGTKFTTKFTGFTIAKVQILTQKALLELDICLSAQDCVSICTFVLALLVQKYGY
jgi:hypothetical protein